MRRASITAGSIGNENRVLTLCTEVVKQRSFCNEGGGKRGEEEEEEEVDG